VSTGSARIIRDPVHNIIPFDDSPCDQLLLDLINTREFQRLRRIRQLGMSQYVFPGANHSRFAHSIGVMHNARRLLDRLQHLTDSKTLNEEKRTIVLVASLLHDVGHGPFSHTFEKITGENHEKRTLEIIRDDSTEVNRVLHESKIDNLPDRLAVFFDEDPEENATTGEPLPKWLTQVVSSQLDADRFDYLRRDSHATGANYGEFDQEWLIYHVKLDERRNRFYLDRKALRAAEAYVFARFHMYQTVYFHKTTRSAEVMLRLLLERYRSLVSQASSIDEVRKFAPDTPPEVSAAFSGQMTLGEYLNLDDHAMTGFFRACERSSDPWLKRLGGGLLHRVLYKAVDMTDVDPAEVDRFREETTDLVSQQPTICPWLSPTTVLQTPRTVPTIQTQTAPQRRSTSIQVPENRRS